MMPALMRSMILRVLLLAVWFNTAIGMPLHAAEHLPGHAHLHGQAQGQAQDHGHAEHHSHADDGHDHGHGHDHGPGHHADHRACGDEDHAAAHAACVWCPSHAQLAMALAAPQAGLLAAQEGRAVFRPAAAAAFVPQPERWRYASRDPPPALRG